ncbi:10003_t:CDS:2 [Entrophospora sp. SA101]|nr:3171_t:CDS:2 [Entrophospora sp. SA101]CAJ0876482.1 10003_t:CDS:2 [Entrophospora sp. SA101]
MPRNQKTQAQLQAEINRLKAENQQFRLVFRIIIETAYQFLKELGQRIVFGRLELETVPAKKTDYPQLFTEIWDNE